MAVATVVNCGTTNAIVPGRVSSSHAIRALEQYVSELAESEIHPI